MLGCGCLGFLRPRMWGRAQGGRTIMARCESILSKKSGSWRRTLGDTYLQQGGTYPRRKNLVELQLERGGGTIEGRVVGEGTGEPIPGATVTIGYGNSSGGGKP